MPFASAEDGGVEAPEQGPKLGVPVSIEHSTVEPASASKLKVGRASLVVPAGPPVIDSDGAVVSTVKLRVWVAELPAPSVARTRKV